MSFTEYVASTREILTQVHAKNVNSAKIIEGNAPFELHPPLSDSLGAQKKYRRGVLLIHGLTDSPYFMRYLSDFFQKCGFRVMAVLLPGHGTQPGDLLNVSWQDWAKTVAYGAYQLSKEVDELYLAGYSTGATLAIYQRLRDTQVQGLFLFSPALQISSRAACANFHKLYSWMLPSAKWLNILPDLDIYKYESFPKNAAAQMYALTKILSAKLMHHGIDVPVFTAASVDDVTVSSASTIKFMRQVKHPASKLVLYANNATRPPENFSVGKLEVVNSAFPAQRILSSAHTALLLPPDDVYYGEGGTYSNCLHYYPDDLEKYATCLRHSAQVNQGEITPMNLKMGTLRRLMYNPNFAALQTSMRQFIDNL